MDTEEAILKWKKIQDSWHPNMTTEEIVEYSEKEIALDQEWKQSLFEKYNLQDVSIKLKERAYALAYQYGHSSGYGEIENYFQDFSSLLKE